MKKLFILLLLALFSIPFFFKNQTKTQPQTPPTDLQSDEVHIHAGFQVYNNNALMDFSDFKYMHQQPCSEEEDHDQKDEQIEKAHLHSGIGNIDHVHLSGSLWKDLFQNINVQIDPSASAFINTTPVPDFLNTPINNYDSLVIFQGENDQIDIKISNAVTKDQIIQAESSIESCGK